MSTDNVTSAASDEPHEDLWRSMQTVVVRDCAPSPEVTQQAPRLEDSPASSCASSSTSSSGGNTPRLDVEVGGATSLASEATDCSMPLAFDDLFGIPDVGEALPAGATLARNTGHGRGPVAGATPGAEDVDSSNMMLPSVEEAQQHLEHILARKAEIKAIAAKYAAPAQKRIDSNAILEESKPKGADTELVGEGSPAKGNAAPAVFTPPDRLSQACPSHSNTALTSQKENRSVRAFGPTALPDTTEVNNVLQQLGRRLQQCKVAEGAEQAAAADKDTSIGVPASPSAASCSIKAVTTGGDVDKGSGFTIGGRSSAPSSTPACAPAPAASLGLPASGQVWRPPVVDDEKLRAQREIEEKTRGELWQSFLAGDDLPVGDDLPPPELYYDSASP